MTINFPDGLVLGHPVLDRHHKEIFDRVGALLDASMGGTSSHEVGKFLDYLLDYVKAHFKEEEGYMELIKYPDRKAHRDEHLGFLRTVMALDDERKKNPGSVFLYARTATVSGAWLREHINLVDRKLVEFVRSRAKTSTT